MNHSLLVQFNANILDTDIGCAWVATNGEDNLRKEKGGSIINLAAPTLDASSKSSMSVHIQESVNTWYN